MGLNAVVNQVQDLSFAGENIRIILSYFIFLSLSVHLHIYAIFILYSLSLFSFF